MQSPRLHGANTYSVRKKTAISKNFGYNFGFSHSYLYLCKDYGYRKD